jgi:hypothetical protein
MPVRFPALEESMSAEHTYEPFEEPDDPKACPHGDTGPCMACDLENAQIEIARLSRMLDQKETIQAGEVRQVRRELTAYKPVIEAVRECYDTGRAMPASVEVAFAHARQDTNLRRLR